MSETSNESALMAVIEKLESELARTKAALMWIYENSGEAAIRFKASITLKGKEEQIIRPQALSNEVMRKALEAISLGLFSTRNAKLIAKQALSNEAGG